MPALHKSAKALAAGLILAVVAACSGGNDPAVNQGAALREARTALQSALFDRRTEADPLPTLTPELVSELTVPTLEVVAEDRDRRAYLVPFSRRGPVTIWQTGDNAQIIIRNGLVTGSRGIGNDLASSDYRGTLTAISRRAGTDQRTLYLRNDLGGQYSLLLSCTLSDLGAEEITIVERRFATRHLRQDCTYADGSASYDFWVESRSGEILQSRQWIGPKIGYLHLRHINP